MVIKYFLFQENGEYQPMFYNLPEACDFSSKIYVLNKIKEELCTTID